MIKQPAQIGDLFLFLFFTTQIYDVMQLELLSKFACKSDCQHMIVNAIYVINHNQLLHLHVFIREGFKKKM